MNVLGRRKKCDHRNLIIELLWPSITIEVLLIWLKYLRIHDISIHINFYQNWFINECVRNKKKWDKNLIIELLWHSMTFEVILIWLKYLQIHDIIIYRNFYQNRFINECVRKKREGDQKLIRKLDYWTFETFNDLWGHT